jgi:hypothetical protein
MQGRTARDMLQDFTGRGGTVAELQDGLRAIQREPLANWLGEQVIPTSLEDASKGNLSTIGSPQAAELKEVSVAFDRLRLPEGVQQQLLATITQALTPASVPQPPESSCMQIWGSPYQTTRDRFIGQVHYLSVLEILLDMHKGSKVPLPVVVLLHGQPGVGKSHLMMKAMGCSKVSLKLWLNASTKETLQCPGNSGTVDRERLQCLLVRAI